MSAKKKSFPRAFNSFGNAIKKRVSATERDDDTLRLVKGKPDRSDRSGLSGAIIRQREEQEGKKEKRKMPVRGTRCASFAPEKEIIASAE
jgi:hypothetical protein